MTFTPSRRAYAAIGLAMLLGLHLRLQVAQGSLWLDEAWSAQFVAQAGDAIGVVWRINHDNNHFLNSWWMLLVGPYAPPMLVRALSIATGVASVAVAGAIGLRRSVAIGIASALLFAVSPILVAYGAEARGYGPMILVMLVSILAIDRWLDDGRPAPVWTLGALTLVGMLAQFTYIFAVAAFAGWIVFTLGRRMSVDAAVQSTIRTLAPSIGAIALVIAVVVAAASASTTGFQAGGYPGFTAAGFGFALSEAVVYTFGLSLGAPFVTIAAALVGIVATILMAPGASGRRFLYVFGLVAFPAILAVALSRIGNAGFARYYLVACTVLLLLAGACIGTAIERGGWRRVVAIAVLAVIAAASLVRDRALAETLRGDPGRALSIVRAAMPAGGSIGFDTIRHTAVLAAAARTAGYPLEIVRHCPAAPFVFIDLEDRAIPPATLDRCDRSYARVAIGRYAAMSGFDWALYAVTPPQKAAITAR